MTIDSDRPAAPEQAARGPARSPSTVVVGLMGGIASGKSRVAALLAGEEGLWINADAIAHGVLSSPEVTRLVAEAFGSCVLDASGQPDRAALGEVVFGDPEARRLLEGWIHPRVRETIAGELATALSARVPLVVLDVPLLLENEAVHPLPQACTDLVFVDAPQDQRDARAVRSRGWKPGEVAARERHQLHPDLKRARADHVLRNDGTPEDLDKRARDLRRRLLDR